MQNNTKKIISVLLSIAFWLAVWQIGAIIVSNSFFLPSIQETFSALGNLIVKKNFFKVIFSTFLRVLIGLVSGIVLGVIFAILANQFSFVNSLVSPLVSIIKATPVASFIILLWVTVSGNSLTVFIAFLMVFPIVWQNLTDGYNAIDKNLTEVSLVFQFSYKKKMKLLIFPTLKKYLVPAIITSSGLAWKSEIAAEIIAYTTNSIGQQINDAKYANETPTVFAWTFLIIVFSILLEKTTKHLLERYKNES